MRLPDCYTLGSKILNSDARARTIREPPRPAMVPVQRFAPAGKRRRRGLTSEQFRFASMTPPARLWQAERADGGHSQAGGRLMSDMRRREVIAVLGGATAIPVIGFVNGRSPDASARIVAAFSLKASTKPTTSRARTCWSTTTGRSGEPSSGTHRRKWGCGLGASRQVGNCHNSDRVYCRGRPGQARLGRQPQSTGRQRNWRELLRHRLGEQAADVPPWRSQLRRVHWSKEASSLGCVPPYWSTPAIKLISHLIIGTVVEAIVR